MIDKPSRRRKSIAERPLVVQDGKEKQAVGQYDKNLLERTRTQWQFGDWESLSQLDRDKLQYHSNRAELALFAAAGHLQLDCNNEEANQLICLALDWGVDAQLFRRIILAGVHNSLGRATALLGEQSRAREHFEAAISIGAPGGATDLLANARAKYQLDALGLLPGSKGLLNQRLAFVRLEKSICKSIDPITPQLRPVSDSLEFYKHFNGNHPTDQVPFLLIDSKSLPRSGLHYLKNTLANVFGENFSFCEWYQEPGCCRSMPCKLTGFAAHARETRGVRIRLTKSHDFELTDPIYDPNTYVRYLILVRDPIYVLTSWFSLSQLQINKDILSSKGININKIWLLHEKEVLAAAYRLLDDNFEPPTHNELADWLATKSQYIRKFLRKWVMPDLESVGPFKRVLVYEHMHEHITSLTKEFSSFLDEKSRRKILNATKNELTKFQKREDPFLSPSEKVTDYFSKNYSFFLEANEMIKNDEGAGIFKSC
jgi:hypothetical protein